MKFSGILHIGNDKQSPRSPSFKNSSRDIAYYTALQSVIGVYFNLGLELKAKQSYKSLKLVNSERNTEDFKFTDIPAFWRNINESVVMIFDFDTTSKELSLYEDDALVGFSQISRKAFAQLLQKHSSKLFGKPIPPYPCLVEVVVHDFDFFAG